MSDELTLKPNEPLGGVSVIDTAKKSSDSVLMRMQGAFAGSFISFASVCTLLLIWEILARWVFASVLIPPFSTVAVTGYKMLISGELFTHIGASLYRIAIGFIAGSLIGAPLGLAMGVSRTLRAIFDPFVQFFRFIPAIAWLTPVVIWFGLGDFSKIMIILYATVFTVAINAAVGVGNIPQNKIWAGLTLGANQRQVFRYVVIPTALPYVLTGMRLAMGYAFTAVVSAEMIASDQGLGFLIFNSRLWMATDVIFVSILVLGFLGWGCDVLFRYATRRLAHNFGPSE
jgi:NitT/TauT family transport system permease protein